MFMFEFAGLFLVILCLAEMSSMYVHLPSRLYTAYTMLTRLSAPTAGGQYHWTSEFAPRSLQKILSYYSGWLASLAWLSGVTGGMYPAGFTLQGLILLANPDFNPRPYQCYLFVVMIATTGLLVNTLLVSSPAMRTIARAIV